MKAHSSRSAPERSGNQSVPAAVVDARPGSQPPGGALADFFANSPYLTAQRRALENLLSCKDGQDQPLRRPPLVQRKLADARKYIKHNKMTEIDGEFTSWQLRDAIVDFAKKHPQDVRLQGLLDAWNDGYANNSNWRIKHPESPSNAAPQGSAGTTSSASSETSEDESPSSSDATDTVSTASVTPPLTPSSAKPGASQSPFRGIGPRGQSDTLFMGLVEEGAYSPSGPRHPPNKEVFESERRMSTVFAKGFEARMDVPIEDARKRTQTLKHKGGLGEAVISGPGRFLRATGKQHLGGTRYAEFLPELSGDLGLSESEMAGLLRHALLDDKQFQEKASAYGGEVQEALTQVVMLFHNEIINRSSTNLVDIIGLLARTENDEDKPFGEALLTTAKFPPAKKDTKSRTGGQENSAIHLEAPRYKTHKSGEELLERFKSKGDTKMQAIWENHKLAHVSTMQKHNISDREAWNRAVDRLLEKYLENLVNNWDFTIKS